MKHKKSLWISTKLREKQIDIEIYAYIHIHTNTYILKKYLSV